MTTLQDILQSAQGGKAAENLAERFGISSEQANAAIQALAPALSIGLQRAIQNPGNLSIIVGELTSSLHLTSYQNAAATQSEAGVAGGSTTAQPFSPRFSVIRTSSDKSPSRHRA